MPEDDAAPSNVSKYFKHLALPVSLQALRSRLAPCLLTLVHLLRMLGDQA